MTTTSSLTQNKKQDELDAHIMQAFGKMMDGAQIPKRYQKKWIDDFIADTSGQKKALNIAKGYIEKFDEALENGVCLTMVGTVGTGKTLLACAILKGVMRNSAINEADRSVKYITVMDMVQHIRTSYGNTTGQTYQEILRNYVNPDLLVLDEVGVQAGTDNEKLLINEVLSKRYNNMKPTIVISNHNLEGLKEYVGERVVDRLMENNGVVLAFDWESNRTK